MKRLTLFILVSGCMINLFSQTYKVVPEKSKITWLGEKVTGEHTGNINIKMGEFIIKDKRIISGNFSIDMHSITDNDLTDETWNTKLVNHLKSEDFFNVEKYPESTFVITESGDFSKGSAMVTGNLTVKNITHPIEFKATLQENDGIIKVYANVIVDRSKYNVRYGSGTFFSNLGDKTIYDEFKLKINLTVVEK